MPKHPQLLTIDGAVQRPLSLTADDLRALPATQRQVTLDCLKGTRTPSTMRGPTISHLMELAGASGSASRLVFYCRDGHHETISLADLIRCDAFIAIPSGNALIGSDNAVRLVVPGKFGSHWAKLVERIEVLEANAGQ